ncbi:hypothetical protein PROSTU_00542 [Providencia stuartii ATCC 25827]|uniref:Uncharacterized protein n=1 Tax=Providencia stuartii ATCC 25827 TaxID=471874 RepID=A0AA87CSW4_PROST|nr:hypothetical protein PROSTU_00542 [Providencia stuartii ATCC 25827]
MTIIFSIFIHLTFKTRSISHYYLTRAFNWQLVIFWFYPLVKPR